MSNVYKTKADYIGLLKRCEQVRSDFGDLKYIRNAKGQEYLILSNIIGDTLMFDITGYSEVQIKHTLAMVECNQMPKNMISSIDKKLEIAKLSQKL